MTVHKKDNYYDKNPRLQCTACGKWMRMFTKEPRGPWNTTQQFMGGCCASLGDHLAGDGANVCNDCCNTKCREMKQND